MIYSCDKLYVFQKLGDYPRAIIVDPNQFDSKLRYRYNCGLYMMVAGHVSPHVDGHGPYCQPQ